MEGAAEIPQTVITVNNVDISLDIVFCSKTPRIFYLNKTSWERHKCDDRNKGLN